MAYLRAPVEIDLDELIDASLQRIADQIAGWVPREGHLEVAVLEELARMVLETAQVAADVPDHIFRAYGRELHDIAQGEGAPATGTAQFTTLDDAGYNIPAGTLIAWRVTGDERVYFTTDAILTVDPGTTTGEIGVTAETAGEHANGYGPGPAELVDALAFIDAVELLDETAGGADAESDDAYRDRLADELQLMAPRPILPADFAVLARRTTGVHRALALDGYDPATDTFDNPRMVTLVPLADDGTTPAAAVIDDLTADMEAHREINFEIHTDEPTYTAVHVEFTIRREAGITDAEALDRAEQAVRDWLTPAHWGGGADSPPVWRLKSEVPYLELASVLSSVDGVDRITALTINGVEDDLALAGVAPLPARFDDDTDPSTVAGTVTS